MSNVSIYDTLLELPLFHGASRERLSEIVGAIKFHFLRYSPGDVIFEAAENCTHIRFILSGRVWLSISAENKGFEVLQTIAGPDVLQPDFLYGRTTSYPSEAVAQTAVGILQIEKADYLRILTMDKVFLINYLNYLSMNAQKSLYVMELPGAGVARRLSFLVRALTQPGAKDVEIKSHGTSFEEMFGTDATSLRDALQQLEANDIIECGSQCIKIIDRRSLLQI